MLPGGMQASYRLVIASIAIATIAPLLIGELLDRYGRRALDGSGYLVTNVLAFDCRFRYPTGFSLDFAFETGPGITAGRTVGFGKDDDSQLDRWTAPPTLGSNRAARASGSIRSTENIDLPPEARVWATCFKTTSSSRI